MINEYPFRINEVSIDAYFIDEGDHLFLDLTVNDKTVFLDSNNINRLRTFLNTLPNSNHPIQGTPDAKV